MGAGVVIAVGLEVGAGVVAGTAFATGSAAAVTVDVGTGADGAFSSAPSPQLAASSTPTASIRTQAGPLCMARKLAVWRLG